MMDSVFDNDELDTENLEFNNAVELVRHTDKFVYLTGKAGTGKTTFLKYVKDTTDKNTVVLAPTGVAAINAEGVTIHSFFQIPFGPFIPSDLRLRTTTRGTDNKENIYNTFRYREDKLKIIENLELLVIDEISMVRADVLDVIDRILRVFRKRLNLPFGGVQVVVIGDAFQLPPVADDEQWSILSQFYKTPFFFSSKVVEQNKPLYIELKKIYRQKEQNFIDILNRIRVDKIKQQDLDTLNSKYNPIFSGDEGDYITLATHNRIVNETNLTRLNKLESELFIFEAIVSGDFPDKNKPTNHFLKLKMGAQVMFIKNDTGMSKRYYNGRIGKIKKLEQDKIIVFFDNDSEIEVERSEWNNIRYIYNKVKNRVEEEIIGTFEQFPIRLAWAITVHKSQGLTFDKVIADLGRAFAPGQVYVALSRCTSIKGLYLKTKLSHFTIKTDLNVLEFARNETPETLVTEELNSGKADYYYKKARKYLSVGDIEPSFEFFKKALKYRNDIDTNTFKRFISVHGSKMLGFRVKYETTLKVNRGLVEELSEAEVAMEEYIEELFMKKEKIVEQNSSIQLLLNKTKEFETKIDLLSSEKRSLNATLLAYKAKITLLELKHKKLRQELDDKITENEMNKVEIERLRNLKWYEKLFGKK